jgi:hypothetical protein
LLINTAQCALSTLSPFNPGQISVFYLFAH